MRERYNEIESKIALTTAQEKAWKALEKAVKDCKKQKVFFYQNLETLMGLNGRNVKAVVGYEETGEPLGDRWHADHFEPVERIIKYVSGKGAVQTGECYRPERHRLDNMMPACPPCNIDKHSMSLEGWRKKAARRLQRADEEQPDIPARKAVRVAARDGDANRVPF